MGILHSFRQASDKALVVRCRAQQGSHYPGTGESCVVPRRLLAVSCYLCLVSCLLLQNTLEHLRLHLSGSAMDTSSDLAHLSSLLYFFSNKTNGVFRQRVKQIFALRCSCELDHWAVFSSFALQPANGGARL